MFRRVRTLQGLMLLARDGPAGRIQDLYFEDAAWRARFLVAQTGRGPAGIQVVIPPYAAIRIDTKLKALEVDLTRLEIERNPVLDTEMPVSVRLRSAQLDTADASGPRRPRRKDPGLSIAGPRLGGCVFWGPSRAAGGRGFRS